MVNKEIEFIIEEAEKNPLKSQSYVEKWSKKYHFCNQVFPYNFEK